jgi:hypothetical protein
MLDHVLTPAADVFADTFGWLFAGRTSGGTYQALRVGVLWRVLTIELTADTFGALFKGIGFC